MKEFEIQEAGSNHAAGARKLYQAIVTELYPRKSAQDQFMAQWQVDDFEKLPATRDRPILLAVSGNNEVVGLMIGTSLEGGVGTIIWLGVSADWRQCNVGRMLLERTENYYNELGGHKIKLFCNTEEAKNFYERCNYTVEGKHPRHWWKIDCWSVGKIIR